MSQPTKPPYEIPPVWDEEMYYPKGCFLCLERIALWRITWLGRRQLRRGPVSGRLSVTRTPTRQRSS